MKKICLSLFLALTLSLGLATPALAAGYYQPLTLSVLDRYAVSFDAAHVEQKTVQTAFLGADDVQEPYELATVNLVELRPGSQISVKKVLTEGGRTGVPGTPGCMVDPGHYITYYMGAVMPYLFHGKAEDSFQDNNLVVLYHGGQAYYVVMGPNIGSAGFIDVADTDYFAQPVQWAVTKGVTNGTGNRTFSPATPCTMAHIITFLHRAQGSPATTAGNPFQDVSSQDYFYTPARWAAEKGLVDGSAFHGDAGCTRANVVTYLWKLAGSPAASGSVFADVAASSELGQAVAWAAAQGIATGTSTTTFSPDKVCTRGEIVTFLYRAYGR